MGMLLGFPPPPPLFAIEKQYPVLTTLNLGQHEALSNPSSVRLDSGHALVS